MDMNIEIGLDISRIEDTEYLIKPVEVLVQSDGI